ncbi:ribonuclease H protein [Tanacetum coccineum]
MFSPNTPMNEQTKLCSRLGVRLMKQHPRYLGLPSIHGRNKGELFSFILEKVLKKMQGWKGKLLSQAGREPVKALALHGCGKVSSSTWHTVASREEAKFISQIPISCTGSLDKIVRHYESKGNYTVKLGYRQALIQKEVCPTTFASSSSTPNKSFWKQIWNLKTLPKIKYFWWKACSNALATHENLSLRGSLSLRLDSLNGYFISRVQNLLDMASSTSEQFTKVDPPINNRMKLNCDASYMPNRASSGIIVRDYTGAIILCSSEIFPGSDPLMDELLAIWSAYRLAFTYGWHNATVESDLKTAISLASSEIEPPWALAVIVVDIKAWASQLAISFSWAKRECNLVAHCFAKIAFNSLVNFVWNVKFSDEITSVASDII